jgi:hypothetical protein
VKLRQRYAPQRTEDGKDVRRLGGILDYPNPFDNPRE